MKHVPAARLDSLCALLVLLCAGLLPGCSPSRGGETVTLRFWAMGREGEVVQELTRAFERENPGIRVEVQQIPWSAAHEKLLTSYVGRSTPDLAQLGNTWVPEFSAIGAIEPLDSWLARTTSLGPSFTFPGIWDTNVIDGMPYGIPWYVDTRLLFYRADLLREAGYDSMPGDWAGWRAAMEAIRRASGGKTYGIFLPINEWAQPAILGLQAGSPLLADNATRGAFSEPPFRRAFAFYVGLFKDELSPPVTNNEIANMYQEFGRGTFAMVITGPWNLGEFARRLPPEQQDDWTTAPLPGPTGPASGLSLAGGSSLVLFRESEHKEEAWKLILFLSERERQLEFRELTGDLPANRAAWDDSSLAADPRLVAFREQLQRVTPTPKVPEWELIASRLAIEAERAVRGGPDVDPDSVLAGLDREVYRILEKRRSLLAHRAGAGEDLP
ncbi:MAG: sugar ABC transporter substrate-binding protein [Candidatus Eisenbacteria bacterium]